MKQYLLVVVIFMIFIISVNLQESSGSNITYDTLPHRFTKIPTVCTIEPNDSLISENKAKDMMIGTKESVLEWKYMLQAQAEKPSSWDIKYVEIPKEQANEFDVHTCDVVISFKRKLEGTTQSVYDHILGIHQYIPSLGLSYIQIFFQQFGTCQKYDGTIYSCTTENIITTPAFALTVRHEFGHALGLDHYVSSDPKENAVWGSTITLAPSIMVMYDSQVKDFKRIQQVDINKVREIYGKNGFGEPVVEEPVIKELQINPNEFPVKEIVVTRGQYTVERLGGSVSPQMSKGEEVEVLKVNPDDTRDVGKIRIKNNYYEYPIMFDYTSLRGTYYVVVNYKDLEISKQAYFVTDTPTLQTPQSEPEQYVSQVSKNSVKVENTDYTLTPTITGGKILGITSDYEAKSLLVEIQTTSDGVLTITLPRDLIDAKINGEDDSFFVLSDGENNKKIVEKHDEIVRTLTIQFEDGNEEIEIIGTKVVPEFGSLAIMIITISVIGVIAIHRKFL